MKKYIVISLMFILWAFGAEAQQRTNDQRTTKTRIADLMMQLPAQNSADLHRIMTELAPIADQAILTSAEGLVAPGKGKDTQLRYSISGLVKFVAEGDDPALIKSCSESLCKALQAAGDDEVKDFLLQELQYVAGNEVLPVVSPLLANSRLTSPAARVMVRVNSDASGQALLDALQKTETLQKTDLVQALGELRYSPALATIKDQAATGDNNLKKASLRALAEIGDPSSAPLLAQEAARAGYQFEETNAAESWFFFLNRLIETGKTNEAEKQLKAMISNNNIPGHAMSGAIGLLAEIPGYKIIPLLLKAQKSSDSEYRGAARELLADHLSPDLIETLRKRMMKEDDHVMKAELIHLLAEGKAKSAFPDFLKLLNDKSPAVIQAAAEAAALVNPQQAVAPLVRLLQCTAPENVAAIQKALLTIKGEEVAAAAAEALSFSSGEAAKALIGIIAKREDNRFTPAILLAAADDDSGIREAAAGALKNLVTAGDVGKVAELMTKSVSASETGALQEALLTALKQEEKQESQVATLVELMKKPGAEAARYYPVLAGIGGQEALQIVEIELKEGDQQKKEAAVKALTRWNDHSALPVLLRISREFPAGDLRDEAIRGYISGINRSPHPADQKVLLLRQAMEMATSRRDKSGILGQISRNPTLQALIFVSGFLEDPELQPNAVDAVRNIVQTNPDLYGTVVTDIVKQSISADKGAEAEYNKEALLKHLAALPEEGFTSMFNGKDLSGWKGLVENPITRAKMTPEKLAEEQRKADERMRRDWKVENGVLVFEGKGFDNLCSEKMYADFELIVDWRMEPKGDGGVYLRGSPQVQTWDTSRVQVGAQVGSGGLYNNQLYQSKPLVVADNPINEWNSFRIKMIGDKVTVHLNGQLVTDNVVLENYWDRKLPIFDKEAIELQAHGTRLEFRDIYVREIVRPEPYQLSKEEVEEGFVPLFNGIDLNGWSGNTLDYFAQESMIVCQPTGQGSGNLFTEKEYSDFIMRFEFQLTPGANNGLGIRAPLTGDAAYVGMELQILDNDAEIYRNLEVWQYHGSVYGVIAAKRGFLKPLGEWNFQEVKAIGNQITITLNGEIILDGNIAESSNNGKNTLDKQKHPGLFNKSGHIGFLGHGSPVKFRNLRIKDLSGNK